MAPTIIVILLLDLALVAYFIVSYNRLVSLRNLVSEAWSGVSVQLKKRHNLIPNLVNTVKGYSSHEKETLIKTIEKRLGEVQPENPELSSDDETQLGKETKQLFALAEAYPELKASDNFKSLQKNLIKIEDDLQYARRYYNATVRDLNTSIEVFPANLFAGAMGFKRKDFFELEYATERKTHDVSF